LTFIGVTGSEIFRKQSERLDKKSVFAYELIGDEIKIEEVGFKEAWYGKKSERPPVQVPFIRVNIDGKDVFISGKKRTEKFLQVIDVDTRASVEKAIVSASKSSKKGKTVNTRTSLKTPIRVHFQYDPGYQFDTAYHLVDAWEVHTKPAISGTEMREKITNDDAKLMCHNLAALMTSPFYIDGQANMELPSPLLDKSQSKLGTLVCVEQGKSVPRFLRGTKAFPTTGASDLLSGSYGEVGEVLIRSEASNTVNNTKLIFATGTKIQKIRGREKELDGVRLTSEDTSGYYFVPFVRMRMVDTSGATEKYYDLPDYHIAEFEIENASPERLKANVETIGFLIKARPTIIAFSDKLPIYKPKKSKSKGESIDVRLSEDDEKILEEELSGVRAPTFEDEKSRITVDYNDVLNIARVKVAERETANKKIFGTKKISLVKAIIETANDETLYRLYGSRERYGSSVERWDSKKGVPMETPPGLKKALERAAIRIAVRDSNTGDFVEI